jgi:hypothetical protein
MLIASWSGLQILDFTEGNPYGWALVLFSMGEGL